MIEKAALIDALRRQKARLERQEKTIERDLARKIRIDIPFTIILSGMRRSGKSTLLRQLIRREGPAHYLNCEDPRTYGMTVSDYETLLSACEEVSGKADLYCFDEIQFIPGWERIVRGLLDENKHVIVTGSTAALMSGDLGTKLTGRHRTYEVFPFSYREFLEKTGLRPEKASVTAYLAKGGFPEALNLDDEDVLREYFTDILLRDVIVKHKLRDVPLMNDFAMFLISNVGKEFSFNALRNTHHLGSARTAIAYVSFLEECYLLFTIPKFEHSLKKQRVNPKKVYAIDTGLVKANSKSTSYDEGRLFENAVFLHLRRKHKYIFYFRRNGECDFIIRDQGFQAVQACVRLDQDNLKRELDGIHEAMDELKLKKGTIVTMDQDDKFGNVTVIPAWKWFLQ